MKKVWDFFTRDLVNTIVLVLMVIFLIASVVKGEDTGLLYAVLIPFVIRFMTWHYNLQDKINAYITDDRLRVTVFGLPPLSANEKIKDPGPLWFQIVSWVIALAGAFLLGYLIVTLIF